MIREIHTGDNDAVLDLVKNVFEEEKEVFPDLSSAERALQFIRERISTYGMLGTFDEDTLQGVLIYDKDSMNILFLAADEQYRCHGIGSDMLDVLCEKADAKHLSRISVNAAGSSIPFYKNYGFEKVDEEAKEGRVRLQHMEYLLGRKYLGKSVSVAVDRPYGSLHPHNPDVLYPLNYGYIENFAGEQDGEFQDAYVYGPEEPVEKFTGIVYGIIFHKDSEHSRWIVTAPGTIPSHDNIIQTVAFEEQYYDTRFIWADDRKQMN
jgi:inorganic pyrophosphatase/N-acetylglutamate synthase-like GNAT family acetyltransferase